MSDYLLVLVFRGDFLRKSMVDEYIYVFKFYSDSEKFMYTSNCTGASFLNAAITTSATSEPSVPISPTTFSVSSLSLSHESMLTLDSDVDFALDLDLGLDLDLDFASGLSVDLSSDLGVDSDSDLALDLNSNSGLDLHSDFATSSFPNLDSDLNLELDPQLDPDTVASMILSNLTPDMRVVLDDCLEAYQKILMSPEE